jgi:hypothetical protein
MDSAFGAKSVSLARAGSLDTRAIVRRWKLVAAGADHAPILHRFGLERNVDAIEKGPIHACVVIQNAPLRASANATRDIEISARARIHRRYQHDAAGVGDVLIRPRQVNRSLLEGLPQYFENVLPKFGQLVQKEHAVVRHG